MNYLRFMILSSPRCGTHMLRTALNNHSHIVCQSEMFNPDFIISENYSNSCTDDEILKDYIFKPYAEDVQAVGFILHRSRARLGDRPLLWDKLQADHNLKIIFLERENLLRRHLSHEVMRAKLNNRDLTQTFDAAELEQEFEALTTELATYIGRFSSHSILRITYEALCDDFEETIGKVQNYLGVERQQVEPATNKNEVRPLSTAITNYASLEDYFSTSRWASFFRETPVSADYVINANSTSKVALAVPNEQYELLDMSINSPTNHVDLAPTSSQWRGQLRVDGVNNKVSIADQLTVNASLIISIQGHDNVLEIDSNVQFIRKSVVRVIGNGNHIKIGRFCRGVYEVRINADQSGVRISEAVSAEGLEIAFDECSEVHIGRDCAFDEGVIITPTQKRPMYNKQSGERTNQPEKIIIGNHVWVGRSSIVPSGVTIGSGSVVDAHTIFNRDTEFGKDSHIGGQPAKRIGKDVGWTRQYFDRLPREHNKDWDD